MIVTALKLFILILRSFSKMIETIETETIEIEMTVSETESIDSTFSIST